MNDNQAYTNLTESAAWKNFCEKEYDKAGGFNEATAQKLEAAFEVGYNMSESGSVADVVRRAKEAYKEQ